MTRSSPPSSAKFVAEFVAPVFHDRLLHLLSELVVGHRRAGHTDDPEARRKQSAESEGVERRNQLALREVARRAEDRERARLGGPALA
jgi:hypothetical protein